MAVFYFAQMNTGEIEKITNMDTEGALQEAVASQATDEPHTTKTGDRL
jgi:hypothetical protein